MQYSLPVSVLHLARVCLRLLPCRVHIHFKWGWTSHVYLGNFFHNKTVQKLFKLIVNTNSKLSFYEPQCIYKLHIGWKNKQIDREYADWTVMLIAEKDKLVGMSADTLALTGAIWYAVNKQFMARSLRPWTRQYSDAKLFRIHDVEFYITTYCS